MVFCELFQKQSYYILFFSVLYKQETLTSKPEEFLDPNKLSDDGTVALSGTAFSEDGATFAYGLSSSGSDWITVQFKRVDTGEDYPEVSGVGTESWG